MDNMEKARQHFIDAVSEAQSYMNESKSTSGVDMKELKYFQIAADAIKKCQEYEEKERNGTLAYFPFKNGDTVYEVIQDCESQKFEVCEDTLVSEPKLGRTFSENEDIAVSYYEIGKTVFADQKEAEQMAQKLNAEL